MGKTTYPYPALTFTKRNFIVNTLNLDWTLSSYNFSLPNQLIAQHPTAKRDYSKLMCLSLEGHDCAHNRFDDILSLLPDDVVLVLNNTKVLPTRLTGHRATGTVIEALLTREVDTGKWEALMKKAKKIKTGEILSFGKTLRAEAIERLKDGSWILSFEEPTLLRQKLETEGFAPLPPYISRTNSDDLTRSNDRTRYQTVYAKKQGAIAAPTAGLHFTSSILAEITKRAIPIEEVTLHVGRGTFEPVKVHDPRQHRMHEEHYEIDPEVWERLTRYQQEKRRIVAVGTTVVRVLETLAIQGEPKLSGTTQIFIYPPFKFRMISGLLTNFHLPKSTLLMLVSALCGRQRLLSCYEEAIREKYRFFSYGDCMLLI
jgi:S-adenosylmethionine:tRNA ribosyltransferase-isomerase